MSDYSYLFKYIIIGNSSRDFLLSLTVKGVGKSCLLN